MNDELKDYYKILGVTQEASYANIENAYRRETSLSWNDPIGRLNISEAYSVLSNPESRREYDRKLLLSKIEKEVKEDINKIAEKEEEATEFKEIEKQEISDKTQEYDTYNNMFDIVNEDKQLQQQEPVKEVPVQEELVKELVQKDIVEENNILPLISLQDVTDEINKEQLDKNIQEQKINTSNGTRLLKIVTATGIVAGSVALGGPIGGVLGLFVAAPISSTVIDKIRKHKLEKPSKQVEIKDVETAETRIFKEYEKKLNNEILKLLNHTSLDENTSYKLEIAILKYKNRIELLDQRIQFKINEGQKEGIGIFKKLEIMNLERQYKNSKKNLETLEKAKANKVLGNSEEKLTKINLELLNKQKEQKQNGLSHKEKSNISIRITKLNAKRIKQVKSMILNKNNIAKKELFWAKVSPIFSDIGYEDFGQEQTKTR